MKEIRRQLFKKQLIITSVLTLLGLLVGAYFDGWDFQKDWTAYGAVVGMAFAIATNVYFITLCENTDSVSPRVIFVPLALTLAVVASLLTIAIFGPLYAGLIGAITGYISFGLGTFVVAMLYNLFFATISYLCLEQDSLWCYPRPLWAWKLP